MKYSIIKEIFLGNRGNIHVMYDKSPETLAANKTLVEAEKDFEKALPHELKPIYDKFIDALDMRNQISVEFYFQEGFKTGVLIGIEAKES